MPTIGDIIELTTDIPQHHAFIGMRGTIVHCHNENAYEVELSDEEGATRDFFAIQPDQFLVVWSAETHEWLSVADQTTAVMGHLPQESAREVLEFARFLLTRPHQQRIRSREGLPQERLRC